MTIKIYPFLGILAGIPKFLQPIDCSMFCNAAVGSSKAKCRSDMFVDMLAKVSRGDGIKVMGSQVELNSMNNGFIVKQGILPMVSCLL